MMEIYNRQEIGQFLICTIKLGILQSADLNWTQKLLEVTNSM